MIVGIDSMVLIYAGIAPRKQPEDEKTEELRIRAKLLLHQHEQDTIVVPTVAAAEIAVPISEEQRLSFLGKLGGYFLCHPFDAVAAAIAAELWAHHKLLPKDERYQDRHLLKADAMIVASAKSAGATRFYSHDRDCRRLASRVMNSYDLPHNDPDDMFALGDIKRGDL